MIVMIGASGGEVSVELCKPPRIECITLLKYQHSMFVSYKIYKMHPEYMLLGAPEQSADTLWSEDIMAQMEISQAAINDATCGLLTYQLKPKGLKGEDILWHMFHHRLCNPTIKSHGTSA